MCRVTSLSNFFGSLTAMGQQEQLLQNSNNDGTSPPQLTQQNTAAAAAAANHNGTTTTAAAAAATTTTGLNPSTLAAAVFADGILMLLYALNALFPETCFSRFLDVLHVVMVVCHLFVVSRICLLKSDDYQQLQRKVKRFCCFWFGSSSNKNIGNNATSSSSAAAAADQLELIDMLTDMTKHLSDRIEKIETKSERMDDFFNELLHHCQEMNENMKNNINQFKEILQTYEQMVGKLDNSADKLAKNMERFQVMQDQLLKQTDQMEGMLMRLTGDSANALDVETERSD